MIVVRDEDRGSGKTTYIANELRKNLNIIAVVPNTRMIRIYPEDVRKRVFTFERLSEMLRSNNTWSYLGVGLTGILIDECFVESIDLPYIYWWAGRLDIDVLAIGTTNKKLMANLGRPIKPME